MSNRTNRGEAVLFVTLFMAVMAEAWILGADNVAYQKGDLAEWNADVGEQLADVIEAQKEAVKHARDMVTYYGMEYRKEVNNPDPDPGMSEHLKKVRDKRTAKKQRQAAALAVGLEIIEQVAAETKPGPVGQCQWCRQYRGLAFIQGTGWLCANCDFDRISEPNDSGVKPV